MSNGGQRLAVVHWDEASRDLRYTPVAPNSASAQAMREVAAAVEAEVEVDTTGPHRRDAGKRRRRAPYARPPVPC